MLPDLQFTFAGFVRRLAKEYVHCDPASCCGAVDNAVQHVSQAICLRHSQCPIAKRVSAKVCGAATGRDRPASTGRNPLAPDSIQPGSLGRQLLPRTPGRNHRKLRRFPLRPAPGENPGLGFRGTSLTSTPEFCDALLAGSSDPLAASFNTAAMGPITANARNSSFSTSPPATRDLREAN